MGITQPIEFEDIEAMNEFYSNFKSKAMDICNKYNVPQLWGSIRMHRDDKLLELSITSVGAHIKGSNSDKAANEIIAAFNEL